MIDVEQALADIIAKGRVTFSDISRGSICEIEVSFDGNTVRGSWYPPMLFGRGSYRSLAFNGKGVPIGGRRAMRVIAAMQDLAEREFEERTNEIVSAMRGQTDNLKRA